MQLVGTLDTHRRSALSVHHRTHDSSPHHHQSNRMNDAAAAVDGDDGGGSWTASTLGSGPHERP